MSTEHDRALARLEALVAKPAEVAELPEDPSMAEPAADEIGEFFLERDGRTIDPDALAETYLAGGLEAVGLAFGEETAALVARLIRCARRQSDGRYAKRLHLCDELL